DVFVVLAGEHGIAAPDFARKDRHALVFGGRTVQGNELKVEEIDRLHQLWHHHPAIIRGERSVVDVSAVAGAETNETGVLDAIPLGGRSREQYAFVQLLFRL